MNPARVAVQLIDYKDLTQDQIFKLAHHIDAYEIDEKIQDNLVIDIYKITKLGVIELVLTPKGGLTYDELSEHLNKIMTYALKTVDLEKCRWEIIDIVFITQKLGKPSYVNDEGIFTAFRSE
jgi:hypothetical protein